LKRYNDPLSTIPCSSCSIGQMRKTRITYFTWLGGQMITVPDFPAWICDICGKREYDLQALDHLELMLCPPAKKPAGAHSSQTARRGASAPSTAPPSHTKT